MTFDPIEIKLIYNCERFKPNIVATISDGFIRILSQITGALGLKAAEIEIVVRCRKNNCYWWNITKPSPIIPKGKTLQEIFEEQAARFPENIALVFEGKTMSYRELNQKANQLAVFLREKGCQIRFHCRNYVGTFFGDDHWPSLAS